MEFPRMCPIRWLSQSDQNFGMCSPHEFMYPLYDMHSSYFRPWKWQDQTTVKELSSTIENEKGNFKITLDVQHFRPNEINVKVSNREIIVEGQHEERPDTHGFVTRQFKRRYPLPSQYPSENVSCTLSSDGILTIIAEKSITQEVEKIVPIKMCGARQTLIETKISSEISEKTQKENIKDTEDFMSKNKSQVMVKEDHSRLLRPELLKEATNGTCTEKTAVKESVDIMKTSIKTDPLNISSTTNKIEESIGKSIMGLTALTEQLGQSSLASTSEMCGMKSTTENKCGMKVESDKITCGIKVPTESISSMKAASETTCGMKAATDNIMKGVTENICGVKGASETICGMKTASETTCGMKAASESTCGMKAATENICGMKGATENICGMKGATENICGMKGASENVSGMKSSSEMSGMKSSLGMSGIKGVTEMGSLKNSSEMSGMKGMSRTVIEESSSSYKSSSSSMSSSMRVSGKTGDCVSDIISAELREAAENV
ncbi:uncharacterized protein LOC142979976 [Anticarsia gemmatalis]|uniref:uncharacterized protein LOC142979976 n=1 Tax=Anticarsia gemmatalis TaxID=129554 RepID=UPI003F763A52